MAVRLYICRMENVTASAMTPEMLSFNEFKMAVLEDYRVVVMSRETSLLGRKEVLTGKAKFGIFGDGKELAQVAMAKFFKPGDFRSGYYRDQTFMFATGIATVRQFFAQLYADPDIEHEPFSAGRQMVSHFVTPNVDQSGEWLALAQQYNVAADMAPTAGQMPRATGLALASKLFRQNEQLKQFPELSNNGNEICFVTIGDASTSEGHFWETVNAICVQQIPAAIFVWDDGYGISVPKKYQTTKASISDALAGFKKTDGSNGMEIYKLKGWDYAGMCEVLEEAIEQIRVTHVPALFHVEEITQPQGHSTSGSHERYKTADRLQWEREWDCLKKMRQWIISAEIAKEEELQLIEHETKQFVNNEKSEAWSAYQAPIKNQSDKAVSLMGAAQVHDMQVYGALQSLAKELENNREPLRRDVLSSLYQAVEIIGNSYAAADISAYYHELLVDNKAMYNSHLMSENEKSALQVVPENLEINDETTTVNGYEVLNKYFDQLFTSNPKVVAFGEDLGFIGDVNQGFAGLQAKYGEIRIFDTGIRELTIMGQGIGLALRGLRPIAEIQYLDYLLYGLQPLSDDLATLQYRTKGKQACPLIVRTRGHRLEGIWHSGSPMGMIIHALRGMHICVPRNMTQAVGMYNTLLASNDPGLVIECLNGYRLKEKLPENLLTYKVPLGRPEIVMEGSDLTIVSYGSTLRIAQAAASRLANLQISCEVIDVQTLLPFDINHDILKSLKKTSRILFVDEDVPGGATSFMFNEVMEKQGGYRWLDATPRTLTAQAHRPAYGSDGDYFSKPNIEDIIKVVREMMME
jgi:pyruvate/2-oxoglutarate/acetoin dehydrogenase E1 component/TPP-dependent pyruvate/acetoin dehydrogenase alpha subunit